MPQQCTTTHRSPEVFGQDRPLPNRENARFWSGKPLYRRVITRGKNRWIRNTLQALIHENKARCIYRYPRRLGPALRRCTRDPQELVRGQISISIRFQKTRLGTDDAR